MVSTQQRRVETVTCLIGNKERKRTNNRGARDLSTPFGLARMASLAASAYQQEHQVFKEETRDLSKRKLYC